MTGKELKKIRVIDLELSQWELAEAVQSYQVHISRMESDGAKQIPENIAAKVLRLLENKED